MSDIKMEQPAAIPSYTGNFGFIIFLILILLIFGIGLFGPGFCI